MKLFWLGQYSHRFASPDVCLSFFFATSLQGLHILFVFCRYLLYFNVLSFHSKFRILSASGTSLFFLSVRSHTSLSTLHCLLGTPYFCLCDTSKGEIPSGSPIFSLQSGSSTLLFYSSLLTLLSLSLSLYSHFVFILVSCVLQARFVLFSLLRPNYYYYYYYYLFLLSSFHSSQMVSPSIIKTFKWPQRLLRSLLVLLLNSRSLCPAHRAACVSLLMVTLIPAASSLFLLLYKRVFVHPLLLLLLLNLSFYLSIYLSGLLSSTRFLCRLCSITLVIQLSSCLLNILLLSALLCLPALPTRSDRIHNHPPFFSG